MTGLGYALICVAIMAGVTYLVRMLPLAIFRRKINNRFVRSFLFYVPYAVLSAMTFPAIFYATGSTLTAVIGTAAAVLIALTGKSLVIVALGASAAVFAASFLV